VSRRLWELMELSLTEDRLGLPRSRRRRELKEQTELKDKSINSDISNFNLFYFFYNIIFIKLLYIIIISNQFSKFFAP